MTTLVTKPIYGELLKLVTLSAPAKGYAELWIVKQIVTLEGILLGVKNFCWGMLRKLSARRTQEITC